jgi:hypothetical protein
MSVRHGRSKLRIIAAWLGLLALVFNALVPIHLAFDLAAAISGDRPEHASHHRHDGHSLLAVLVGHRHHDSKPDAPGGRGHLDCAVCGSITTLAGFAGTSAVTLSVPALIGVRTLRTAPAVALCSACFSAYRSRAPPVG